MRSYLTCRTLTTALSGIILGGLALSGVAYAVTGAVFRYPAPKTGYLMIPTGAFTPTSTVWTYDNFGNGLGSTGSACFLAPVHLPQGAKMTQLATWYEKNDATSAVVQLVSVAIPAKTQTVIAQIIPSPTGGAVQQRIAAVDPAGQTVNNAHFGYYVSTCLSDQETFIAARIKYTYTTAGD